MEKTRLVLYHGPDAVTVTERWQAGERPFELAGVANREEVHSLALEEDVGAMVLANVSDSLELVDRIRTDHPDLPVVLVGDVDADASDAIARGVTHYVHDDGDRIALLESFEPFFDRYRRERRERTMLDSLLENVPLSVYFKDHDGRFVRVSDAMLTMTGTDYIENPEGKRFHAAADVVGTTDFDLFPAEPAEMAVADDRMVIETEASLDNKIEHVYGSVFDGTFVATSKAPWYDDRGRVVGLVGVTRDVSERKQYEHQLERHNDRLQRFAQVISHDLRNPLEVARGRLELAREDCESEHFEAIERSVRRMDELVEDVLALARQGETVTDPEPVSLAAVARDAWSVIESGDADLVVETDATIDADPGRLQQVFENLFRNAVEHGSTSPASQARQDAVEHGSTSPDSQTRRDAVEDDPAEGGTDGLTVTVTDIHGDRGFVVCDDGPGIPEAQREAVFEAGFTTERDGTGLGLNIVQTIADAHGWRVSVTDSDSGGAAFRFENPHLDDR